jgi:hypothetical protein
MNLNTKWAIKNICFSVEATMRKNLIITTVFLLMMMLVNPAFAEDAEYKYKLGQGFKLGDALTVGGYFSTEYSNKSNEEEFKIDDLALLLYGSFQNNFSYLLELESVEFYKEDIKNNISSTNIPPIIERFYLDYKKSDQLSFRIGKQITPIGYWNLQPINVLRETSSNPILSRRMFPKFLSGLDVYGFTPFDNDLKYHFFMQGTKDMDNDRINIDADSHVGFSLEKYFQNDLQAGASSGRFTEVDDSEIYYLQLNSRLDKYNYSLITEAIFDYKKPNVGKSEKSEAFYLQGEYRFNPKHAVIGRVEYFHNDEKKQKERIGVLGYSYRPLYPISLKIEYQWHADSDSDGILSSFSVLF